MRKIAVEAASVKVPTRSGEITANTVSTATQLIQLLDNSPELRWLIPYDPGATRASWWVWTSFAMIHADMIKALGYDIAKTGYIYSPDPFKAPGHIAVFWYDDLLTARNQIMSGDGDPTSNATFRRVLSNPVITIEEMPPPHSGMSALKPEQVPEPVL